MEGTWKIELSQCVASVAAGSGEQVDGLVCEPLAVGQI